MSNRFLVAVFIACFISVPVRAEAWSQFQGNAAHTGYVAGVNGPSSETPVWSITPGSIVADARLEPGVASDGRQLFFSWQPPSQPVNAVRSVDLKTGQTFWDWQFTGKDYETMSAPTYDDGRVFIHRWGHSSSCGIDCHDHPRLLGMDADDGHHLFDRTHAGQWSSGGRPTALGGNVYCAGGYYGGLDAYNGQTGVINWFRSLPQTYGWISAADDANVYVAFNGDLYVLNPSNGDYRFTIEGPGASYSHSTPAVADPTEVYVVSGNVTRFDTVTQTLVWTCADTNARNQGIAIGADSVYVNFGDSLRGINRETGAVQWNWSAPEPLNSNVIVTDAYAYVGSASRTYAVGLGTGTDIWSVPYGGSLALVDGMLIVSSSTGITAFAVPEPTAISMLLVVGVVAVVLRRRHAK